MSKTRNKCSSCCSWATSNLFRSVKHSGCWSLTFWLLIQYVIYFVTGINLLFWMWVLLQNKSMNKENYMKSLLCPLFALLITVLYTIPYDIGRILWNISPFCIIARAKGHDYQTYKKSSFEKCVVWRISYVELSILLGHALVQIEI